MLYFSMYQVVQDKKLLKILNKVKEKKETQPELKLEVLKTRRKKT